MRALVESRVRLVQLRFPFLFGGTFIEGGSCQLFAGGGGGFPFLFGGTFIEGADYVDILRLFAHFPSFSEGLSLRG